VLAELVELVELAELIELVELAELIELVELVELVGLVVPTTTVVIIAFVLLADEFIHSIQLKTSSHTKRSFFENNSY
jgi:hypothetical protein